MCGSPVKIFPDTVRKTYAWLRPKYDPSLSKTSFIATPPLGSGSHAAVLAEGRQEHERRRAGRQLRAGEVGVWYWPEVLKAGGGGNRDDRQNEG
eukprot:IDg5206t1